MSDPNRHDHDDLDELGGVSHSTGGLGEMTDDDDETVIEAYCVRCKETVEMEDPTPVWTARGAPGTRGTCPYCASTVFRMGMTDAHRDLVRPHAVKVESATKIATSGRKRAQAAAYLAFCAADAEFARKLAADLQNAGVPVYVREDIGASVEIHWAGGVHPALKDSPRMVLVLSPESLNDESVTEAWKFFRAHKKSIVIASVGSVAVPDDLRRCPRFSFDGDERSRQRAFRDLSAAMGD